MLWTHFYIYFCGHIQVKCLFFQSPFSLEHNDAAGTSGSPNSVEVCWDFEFIREYIKINKTRSKFHFLTKIEIKMTPCVFVLFFYCLFTSWAIWKQFYGRLRFWVVLTIRNKGRLGTEAERSSSKLHKSHKNGPNSPKLLSNCLLCFLSLRFHQNCSRSAWF